MEDKKLNIKKVIITIAIFVFAFFIILGSAVLTNSRYNEKKGKDLEIKGPNKLTIDNTITKENVSNIIKNNIIEENQNFNHAENVNIAENINNIEKNKNNKIGHEQSETTKNLNSKVPIQNPQAIELCKQAQTSDEKNIYLTFDDGPSPNITPQILDILKQYNVPATFFVLGSRVDLYPEILRREYSEGHFIANHGYSHQYSSMYSSVQSVIDEYNKADLAVKTALGNPNYNTLLFRFPGGSSGGPYNNVKQEAKKALENMGIVSTNWNCLNGDAEEVGRTKEQLINRLYETAERWNSLVVLMHDANDKQATVDALPIIIEHYLSEGYTFKNYYDIFQ